MKKPNIPENIMPNKARGRQYIWRKFRKAGLAAKLGRCVESAEMVLPAKELFEEEQFSVYIPQKKPMVDK